MKGNQLGFPELEHSKVHYSAKCGKHELEIKDRGARLVSIISPYFLWEEDDERGTLKPQQAVPAAGSALKLNDNVTCGKLTQKRIIFCYLLLLGLLLIHRRFNLKEEG